MKDDKAKKQIQKQSPWIPAFAGMTAVVNSGRGGFFNNPSSFAFDYQGGSEKPKHEGVILERELCVDQQEKLVNLSI